MLCGISSSENPFLYSVSYRYGFRLDKGDTGWRGGGTVILHDLRKAVVLVFGCVHGITVNICAPELENQM